MFAKHYEKVTWKHINDSVNLLKGIERKYNEESFRYDTFSSWYKKLNRSFKEISDKCYDNNVYNKDVAHFFKVSEECIKKLSSLYSKDHFYYSHELVTILIKNLWSEQYIHTDGEISISDVNDVVSSFKEKHDKYIRELSNNQFEIEQVYARANEIEEDIRLLDNNSKTASTTKKAQNEQKKADLIAEYNKLRKQADDFVELNDQIKLQNHLGDIIDTGLKTNNPEAAYNLSEQAKDLEAIESQKEETRKVVKNIKANKYVKDYASDFNKNDDVEKEVVEEPSLDKTKPSDDLDRLHPELFKELSQKVDTVLSNQEKMKEDIDDIKSGVHRTEDKLDKLAIEVSKLSVDELVKRLSELFTANVKQEESGEEDTSSNEEILVYEAELARRNISCRETVNTLIGLNPPDFIGAYSNIRTLIDSYCRYVHGIELDGNHRLFNPSAEIEGSNGIKSMRFLLVKPLIFSKIIFPKYEYTTEDEEGRVKIGNYIYDDYNTCSENVHITIKSLLSNKEEQIEKINALLTQIVDEAGIDYTKIDYVEGVKKLYAYEVKSINRFVNCDYIKPELANPKATAKHAKLLYDMALDRIEDYKKFLLNNEVGDSFFITVGKPKPLTDTAITYYLETVSPKKDGDSKPTE